MRIVSRFIISRFTSLSLADAPSSWLMGSVILVAALMFSACASTQSPAIEARTPESRLETRAADVLPRVDAEHRLRAEVAEWAGVPHVLGGSSVRGIDCSAFVQQVYAAAFDVRLPRTTREQVQSGVPVRRNELVAGDLVFFTPPSTARHVGVYLEDGEFAHASSSQGVIISRLDEAYWERAYWTSRRILPASVSPAVPSSVRAEGVRNRPPSFTSEGTDLEAPRRKRTGW